MTGVVIIRMPTRCIQIHRARLILVGLHPNEKQKTTVVWMHFGDVKLTEFDTDVDADDDDKTDFAELAQAVYRSIAYVEHQNVTWTWGADKKWSYVIEPADINLSTIDSLDEDHVGYGSLGR